MENLSINLRTLALCAFISAYRARLDVFCAFKMDHVLPNMLMKLHNELVRMDNGQDFDLSITRKLNYFQQYDLVHIALTIRDREGNYPLLSREEIFPRV